MSAPLCEHCTSHDRGACEGVRQFATITAACSCGCHFAPQVGGAVVLVSSDALAAAVARAAAAEARHAALAGAVREVGDLIAEHGCSCDCDCAHTTGEHTSACDPCLACRASDVVSPLLRGAAPDVVRAGVVRAYLTAEERWREGSGVYRPGEDVAAYVARRDAERVRVSELHKAMVAALAAAEGR